MKRMKFILFLILSFCNTSYAGQNGNGGDSYSLLFTNTGHRLHRELLMEPYNSKELQFRDHIPLSKFYEALLKTKVTSTDKPVLDRHGHEATARHYEPHEVAQMWRDEGVAANEIEKRLQHYPFGLILVNRTRLRDEISLSWAMVFKTVFHEYARVMGINEDNYVLTTSREADEFFARLYQNTSPLTKEIVAAGAEDAQRSVLGTKIDLIDREKARLRKTMTEDTRDLEAVLIKRGHAVDERKKAYTKWGNAYADMIGSMGIVPMPFPEYRANIVRGITKSMAGGMTLEQKITEFEVINDQMNFLKTNLQLNRDFFQQLEVRRKELIMKALE